VPVTVSVRKHVTVLVRLEAGENCHFGAMAWEAIFER
jgi:hypothetical protein